MLSVAEELCRFALPVNRNVDVKYDILSGRVSTGLPLIFNNGDSELWEKLCSFGNPIPLRVLEYSFFEDTSLEYLVAAAERSFYDRDGYPSAAHVGNDRGDIVQGLDVNNCAPWCIRPPEDPALLVHAQQFASANARGGRALPFCPPEVVTGRQAWPITKLYDWATRGALNAGFSVFLYLDQVSRGYVSRGYDQCELLK
jgi:hypothetical protein